METEHGPSPEEMGISEEEQSVQPDPVKPVKRSGVMGRLEDWTKKQKESMGLDPNDKRSAALQQFEKFSQDTRKEVGAREDESAAAAWLRKKFGKPEDPKDTPESR